MKEMKQGKSEEMLEPKHKNEMRWWIVLAVVTAVYHVVIFSFPFPKSGVFWISYLFTLVALAAQVYVIRTAFFRGKGIQSKFYGFPIAGVGILYMGAQMILGLVFMVVGALIPLWISLVFYVVLAGAAAIGLIGADAVREEVERQEIFTNREVGQMRKFQININWIASQNSIPELREALRKLSEAFRFSDPVSSEDLKEAEDTLAGCLARLQDAVALGETEKALKLCRETESVLKERNEMCKLSKHT